MIVSYDHAAAVNLCVHQYVGQYICHTNETGPLCPYQYRPYYLYFHPTCGGGPLNCPGAPYWVGCCPGFPIDP